MTAEQIETGAAVLTCSEVIKEYREGKQTLRVLDGLNANINAGETVAIVGVSGSGKTTLLNLLGGLDDPSSGAIALCGQDWSSLKPSARAAWRNAHIGFVYQFHHLLPEFDALENIAMPLRIAGIKVAEANQRAAEMLALVGLESRRNHKPAMLSGGERQRVAIARALVTSPDCVLMDEPTGNLDPQTASVVLELLHTLNKTLNIALVIVTHDHDIARQMSRALELTEGRLQPWEASV